MGFHCSHRTSQRTSAPLVSFCWCVLVGTWIWGGSAWQWQEALPRSRKRLMSVSALTKPTTFAVPWTRPRECAGHPQGAPRQRLGIWLCAAKGTNPHRPVPCCGLEKEVAVDRPIGRSDGYAPGMASGLRLRVYRPRGRLASYVRAFQVLSTEKSARVSVLDFVGADVSVPLRFGDPVVIEDSGPAIVESAALVGPRTRSVWLRFDGTIDQVNVSFFPGVAGAFIGLSMPELVGRVVALDDVWPSDFRQAVADLEPLPVQERVSRLEPLLLARLDPRLEGSPQVREAVRLIHAKRGRVRVHWLADQVNLSVSQLERTFKRHVGVGPKLLARQKRASELAAEAMAASRPDWAWLAYRYGYSDQAHLVREFRELLGLTPSAFGAIGKDADFLQDALASPSLA